MRKLMKLIAITAMAALLLCMVISCASADEKIYTSPVFKLPKDQLTEWAEELPEEPEEPEESETPEELPEEAGEDGEPEETAEPAETGEETDEGGETGAEPEKPERAVLIFSTQKKVVTEGEFIYLTSELIGFDDVEVTYQWQVNKDDGAGWVDVEGATRDRHMFIASEETIRYGWRLIVNVVE
jgi:hypothetical protein